MIGCVVLLTTLVENVVEFHLDVYEKLDLQRLMNCGIGKLQIIHGNTCLDQLVTA